MHKQGRPFLLGYDVGDMVSYMDKSTLKTWKDRIDRAQAIQNQQHKEWKDALDIYNCDYFNRTNSQDPDRVDVNFGNWYVNNLIPLVYFRDPYIFSKSRNSQWSGFAQTMEDLLNLKWGKLRLKQQFKRVIHSGFLLPPGWIKLGYTAKIHQDVAKIDEEKEKGFVKGLKDLITGIVSDEKERLPEEMGVLDQYIKEESCFVTWVPSHRMLMPEGYQLVTDMPYLIEIEDVHLMDFLNNSFYKKERSIRGTREVSQDADGGATIRKPRYTDIGSTDKNDSEIIRLYHVWDRRSQMRCTVSMESETPHFEGDWPYDMEGFPYEPLIFEENLPSVDKSNPYPTNVLKPIMSQLTEKSSSRTQMAKYRKRASAIIMADATASEEDMRQVEETEAVQIIKVRMKEAFQMTATPNLPPTVFEVDKLIDQDLQQATNMGQMMFMPQSGQRTATQAQLAQTGLQLKAQARVDVVEDFTVQVARKLAQCLWQFYDREKVAEELGVPVSVEMWPDLPKDKNERRRIIQSEIQFRIDAGSTAPPKDETVDRKQLLDLASIVSTIAPELIKKGPFIKKLVESFPYLKDADQFVITDDGMEQQVAMQENQLMMQGAPQAVGPNENHEVHIQIHSQVPPHPLVDQHIQSHAQFLGVQTGAKPGGPQQGDIRPPMKSSNPEINRQGATNQGDIYQSVQNTGVGSGPEAM